MLIKILIACVFTFGTISAQIIPDGSLIFYYSFSGNVEDSSENELHGISNNISLVEDISGNENSAYYFNGDESFISLSNDDQIKVGFPFTFSCWIKLDKHQVPIFTNDFQDNIYSGALFFISSNGKFGVTLGNGGPIGYNSRHTKVTYNSINIDQWYHVAGVVKDFYNIDLYVNGILEDGSYDGGGTSLYYTNGNSVIGMKDQDMYSSPAYFNGTMDEVFFFKKSLELHEIQTLFNNNANSFVLEIPNIISNAGDTISVPVNIYNPNNYNINSFEIKIDYPKGDLLFDGLSLEGSLLKNKEWLFSVNDTENSINISGAGSQAIINNGNMLFVRFVISEFVSESQLGLNFISALINDDSFETITKSGIVIIASRIIKGDVDNDSRILAFDASYILKYLVDDVEFTPNQLYAADVSLDSTVSSLDAKLILDYTTELIDTIPFIPSTNLKYAFGQITMPISVQENSGFVKIPISVVDSENISSFESEISFDSYLYSFETIEWSEEIKEFNIEINENNGLIKIAGFGNFISRNNFNFGELLLRRKSETFTISPVLFNSVRWNESIENKNVAKTIIDVPTDIQSIPQLDYNLNQNYPNPFNPTTSIVYEIPSDCYVSLKIYDILGNEIRTLVENTQFAGKYTEVLDASNLSSGLYLYRLVTENISISKKMILIK